MDSTMSIASQYIDELFALQDNKRKIPARLLRLRPSPSHLIKLRTEALKKQHGRCFYCGDPLSKKDATADHIIPQSKGGKTSKKNIVAACSECNSDKGSRDIEEFMAE